MGQLSLDFYTRGTTTPLGTGPTPVVGRPRIRRAVGQVGSFSVEVPANDPHYIAVRDGTSIGSVQGLEISLRRDGDGERFRGIITDIETGVDEAGNKITKLSGGSLAIELTWLDTYNGVIFDDDTISDSIDAVLSGSGWTKTVTGVDYVNVTDRHDNMKLFASLAKLAEIEAAYLRETNTRREIEMSRSTSSTGIRITNVEEASPALYDNALLAPIRSIRETRQGSDIVTRIVAYGEDAGNVVFDLGDASLSSPYTVQSFVKNRPSITDAISDQFNDEANGAGSTPVVRTFKVGTLKATGRNRMVVVFAAYNNTYQRNGWCRVGGVEAELVQVMTLGGNQWHMFLARNPRAGELEVTASYETEDNSADVESSQTHVVVVAVAVQDVDQSATINSAEATGSGTAAAVTLAGASNDLRLAGVSSSSNFANPTSGANQTRVLAELDNTQTDVVVDYSLDDSDSSLSFTLPTSETWGMFAIQLPGAVTYYIEDATAVTAYGTRVEQLIDQGSKLVGASTAQRTAAADSLYARSVTKIQRKKDERIYWDVAVPYLPSFSWLVGDSFVLDFHGEDDNGVWLDVDNETVYAIDRTEEFDEAGVCYWALKLSTVYEHPLTTAGLLVEEMRRLKALEASSP